MQLIEAEFGIKGFGVVVRLRQMIHGQEGYYIEWTKEVALLFSHNIGEGEGVVSEIIEASIKRGIFDREIFDKYGVLTSREIQETFFEATKRRKNQKIYGDILLVNADSLPVDVRIKLENANISEKNANISEQSKVKESKVKESKVKKSTGPPTRDEVRAYAKERNSDVDPDRFYDYFEAGGWVDSRGSPVKAWKQKFITWERKSGSGNGNGDNARYSQPSPKRTYNIKYDNELD